MAPQKIEPFGQATQRAVRAVDGGNPLTGDAKESLRASASLGGWIPGAGLHIAFCLETIQRGIDGADGDFAFRACLNLLPNGNTVGLVMQPQNREKYNVLEFAEIAAIGN